LLLLLGFATFGYSQPEKHEQDAERPKQDQQARPEPPKQESRQESGRQQQQPQERSQQEPQAGVPQAPQQKHAVSSRRTPRATGQRQSQPSGLKKQGAVQQPQQQTVSPVKSPAQHPATERVKQSQHAASLKKQQQVAPSSPTAQPSSQSRGQGVWQQQRATHWQTEHRNWQQRGGYNGYRIPEDHFRGSFGQDHGFRMNNMSMEMYSGHPRFQYGGYWFGVIDPWPEYWAGDWYENDDVYVEYYGDGYYLLNRRYPDDRIAVTVYMN
jgi:hypothetical protein